MSVHWRHVQRWLRRCTLDPDTGCWLWNGAITSSGYGNVNVERINRVLHRVVYETLVGPVPRGLDLDHVCRVRRCCNPFHLEPVTRSENLRRGKHHYRDRDSCHKGHPLSGANVTTRPDNGARVCLACRNEYNITRRQRYAATRQLGSTA